MRKTQNPLAQPERSAPIPIPAFLLKGKVNQMSAAGDTRMLAGKSRPLDGMLVALVKTDQHAHR
jgi:hypothetical protein